MSSKILVPWILLVHHNILSGWAGLGATPGLFSQLSLSKVVGITCLESGVRNPSPFGRGATMFIHVDPCWPVRTILIFRFVAFPQFRKHCVERPWARMIMDALYEMPFNVVRCVQERVNGRYLADYSEELDFKKKLESLPKTPLRYFPFPELKQRFTLVHVSRWESVSLNPLPRFLRALGVLDVNSFGADTLVALTGEECWDMGRVCRKKCHYGTIDAGWSWWNICLNQLKTLQGKP